VKLTVSGLLLPGTPKPWIPINAQLSPEVHAVVNVNEEYIVTCNEGYEFYDNRRKSFLREEHGQVRSLTVKNVKGRLELFNQNIVPAMDELTCKMCK